METEPFIGCNFLTWKPYLCEALGRVAAGARGRQAPQADTPGGAWGAGAASLFAHRASSHRQPPPPPAPTQLVPGLLAHSVPVYQYTSIPVYQFTSVPAYQTLVYHVVQVGPLVRQHRADPIHRARAFRSSLPRRPDVCSRCTSVPAHTRRIPLPGLTRRVCTRTL